EVNLLHPQMSSAWSLPVYTCGYSDDIDCIDENGTVEVPAGAGLGVTYDAAYIDKHRVSQRVISID
ncbi:MAG: L-alanine-DL-glutamate epimerase-like enolase superfamily enzyme, partial [Gammaproteobacteria bacterium]